MHYYDIVEEPIDNNGKNKSKKQIDNKKL